MPSLTATEKLRLKNLCALHARPEGYGAPTAVFLAEWLTERGASITNRELSLIYKGERAISDHLAKSVERAFSLPAGWLSADHEFVYKLSPGELIAHSELAALPVNVKQRLFALVEELSQALRRDRTGDA